MNEQVIWSFGAGTRPFERDRLAHAGERASFLTSLGHQSQRRLTGLRSGRN